MAEFKKFEIDRDTFEAICKKAYEAYDKADNLTLSEDFKEALEKTIFDVKYPFDIGRWNRCTVKVPCDLSSADLIIRKIDVEKFNGVNATDDHNKAYYTGWSNGDEFSVSGYYPESVQDDIEEQILKHPEKWEYRVIPFK